MFRLWMIVLVIALSAAGGARAHALRATCNIEGERVVVEAFFSDKTPARDAEVTVREGKIVVAQGRTDDAGRWSFPKPPPGQYDVIVDAGMGHRTASDFTVSALGNVSTGPSRDELTRTPWLRIALGLLAITGLALGLRWCVRRSPPQTGPES